MNRHLWICLNTLCLCLFVWMVAACGNPSLAQNTQTEDASLAQTTPAPTQPTTAEKTSQWQHLVATPTEEALLWQDILDHVFAEMHTLDPTAKLIGISYLPKIGSHEDIQFGFIDDTATVWSFMVKPALPLTIDRLDEQNHPQQQQAIAKMYQAMTVERSRMVVAPWQAYALVDQQKPAACANTSEKDFVLILSEAGEYAKSWSISDTWSVWYMECDTEYYVDMLTGDITLEP